MERLNILAYRYDNIRITCETYGIPLYSIDDYKENIEAIKNVMYDNSRKSIK